MADGFAKPKNIAGIVCTDAPMTELGVGRPRCPSYAMDNRVSFTSDLGSGSCGLPRASNLSDAEPTWHERSYDFHAPSSGSQRLDGKSASSRSVAAASVSLDAVQAHLEFVLNRHQQHLTDRFERWVVQERHMLANYIKEALNNQMPSAKVSFNLPVVAEKQKHAVKVRLDRAFPPPRNNDENSLVDSAIVPAADCVGLPSYGRRKDGSQSTALGSDAGINGNSASAAGESGRRRMSLTRSMRRRSQCVDLNQELEEADLSSIWSRMPTNQDVKDIEKKLFPEQCGRAPSTVGIVGKSLRTYVQAVVFHRYFEVVASVMIFFNTGFMGVEVEVEALAGTQDVPNFIRVVNYIFTWIFAVELLLRLVAFGRQICDEEHRLWAFFDTFLVVSGIFDLIAGLVNESGGTAEFSTARMMRIIRITRMLRVLRFVRLVQFIRALRVLIFSIVTTLKSVAWAVLLLFIVIYCFALVFTQAAADSRRNGDSAESYWGDLGTSMMTLLESITGGLDWVGPMEALQNIHWVWMVIFVGFILFTYFAILNVMTAAFCQGAIEGKLYDRDQTVRDLLMNKQSGLHKTTDLFKNMFDKITADANGEISWPEFQEHLKDESVQALLALLELEDSDLWVLFQILDSDGSQRLDVHEFMHGCMRLKGNARSIDLAKLAFENQRLSDRLTLFMRFVRDELIKIELGLHVATKTPERRASDSFFGADSIDVASGSVSLA